MRTLLTTILVVLTFSCSFAQYTPATVPNVKLITNSYVSDPDHLLPDSSVAQIDSMLKYVEEQSSAQVGVVVLNSIGDADIFDFSQELFNLWGIGAHNNNGLLIVLVMDQRTVRFHTGTGLEGILPDAVCKQIQRVSMVPEFKNGNYGEGMVKGVATTAKVLTDEKYAAEIMNTEPSAVNDEPLEYSSFVIGVCIFLLPVFLIVWAVKRGTFADSKPSDKTDYPQMRLKQRWWLIEFGLIPALIIVAFWFMDDVAAAGFAIFALYFYYMATVVHRMIREKRMINRLVEKGQYFLVSEYFRKSSGFYIFMAIIFPLPFLAYAPAHFWRKNRYRNHPRTCKQCSGKMTKLSETEDDAFLTPGQRVEEQINSIDYDVWKCTGCGATEYWTYKNRWTHYEACPHCKAVAYYVESKKTLKSATYSSSGKGELIRKCKSCNKTKRETYSIAQLTSSSSSSSSSSSGSYSSGSSSSGGSWGGGSSSGGGASSSW